MKSLIKSLFLATIIFSCNTATETKTETITSKEKTKMKPSDFMLMQRSYPHGKINTAAISEALQWRKAQKSNSLLSKNIWELVGPLNIGGRITDVEMPVDSDKTIYVGAASGGIFKTTDGGSTWNPMFDEQDFLSIGDMEISKKNTNTIWVGTGEVNTGGGSMTYDGNGIYKSTDGGVTWESKGLPKVGGFGKVVIDPNDDNTVFAGAMGAIFRTDEYRGVFRTKDGGKTWKKVLFISNKTGVVDMAIHPKDGNIVYAATWERERTPYKTVFGGATSGIYRSKDGGDTWEELKSGLPSSASEKGRISIALSESNPDVIYARYATTSGKIQGVYRSSNGGDSWQKRNSSQLSDIGFHWWFRGLYVDPTNENIIYNVDYKVQKSTDGGNNWSNTFSNVHVDQHALAFNRKKSGQVLLGNDGGLYYSNNGGSSPRKEKNLPITQFYKIDIDQNDDKRVFGGAQDNSVMRTTTGSKGDWEIVTGGDGFQPLIDPNNPKIVFALSQNGNLVRSTNGGAFFTNSMSGISGNDRKNWDTPITFDPSNTSTVYYGANKLYKSTNSGKNWSTISGDHSKGKSNSSRNFATIFTIDVSPLDSKVIYTGTDDGNVWVTKDGGSNWTKISDRLPNRWVTKVLADPKNKGSVYVTYSGYNYGEIKGHVYKSENYGKSWKDISNNLPDTPVNDIIKDDAGNLYLGTDIGVLGSANDGTSWQVVGENLPSVRVPDLVIHKSTKYLYAGTFGRSIYKIDISRGILSVDDNNLLSSVKTYPNPVKDVVTFKFKDTYKTINVILHDALGREVLSKSKNNSNTLQLKLNNFSSGTYYAKISNGKASVTKKLLVK